MSRKSITGSFTDIYGLGITLYALCQTNTPLSPTFNFQQKILARELSIPILYSPTLHKLTASLLEPDYRHRPTVEEILAIVGPL